MKENDLDKVLNYMKQYVENKYEHDSEPMLTYKDLQLVLNEIERLHSIIKEVREEIIKDRKKNYGDLGKKAFYCNKTDKLLEILGKEVN